MPDSVDVPDCNRTICHFGNCVCVLDGDPDAIERWVKAVAQQANAYVDWYYMGGRARVLHLGFAKSRLRVLRAIDALEDELGGRILSVHA
jgi:hypothetical protein